MIKEFSEYEKVILKNLILLDETPGALVVLGNFIPLENYSIKFDSESTCTILITEDYLQHISLQSAGIGVTDLINNINKNLVFITQLFKYLEEEKLIYLNDEYNLHSMGNIYDSSVPVVSSSINDKEVSRLIYYFARKRIIPAESLKNLVKKIFMKAKENGNNEEQIVHDPKSHWWIKVTFWVIVIGVILAAFPIYEYYSNRNEVDSNDTNKIQSAPASKPFNYTIILKDLTGDQVKLTTERLTLMINGIPFYGMIDTFNSRFVFENISEMYYNKRINVNLVSEIYMFSGGKHSAEIFLNGMDTVLILLRKEDPISSQPRKMKPRRTELNEANQEKEKTVSKQLDSVIQQPLIEQKIAASGIVLDSKGEPIEDVRISVLDGKYFTFSNSYGEYVLKISSKEPDLQLLRVILSKQGFKTFADNFNFPSENHRAILKLQ